MLTTRERKQRKADRLRDWAEKRTTQCNATLNADSQRYRGDVAFNTQPGHIPERARVIARTDRAFESLRKAGSMEARADGIERQAAQTIYADDEDATERLREKIDRLKAEQERMKQVNTVVRKFKHDHHAGRLALEQMGFPASAAEGTFTPDFCGRIGFPAYALQNNNANIRRLEARLAQIAHDQIHGAPWRHLWTKYAGPCTVCGVEIPAQQEAHYRRGDGLRHVACAPAPEPIQPPAKRHHHTDDSGTFPCPLGSACDKQAAP